jgi:hypothetical protein
MSLFTVAESDLFTALVSKIWSDDEREEFVDWISENPEAGDVIPGSGGLRKVRWSRAGMGKSGGVRVIYYLLLASGKVLLLMPYVKSNMENLSKKTLKALREIVDAYP